MGPAVIVALVVAAASGTITMKQAVAGYGESVVWLVVGAFLIAGAVQHTGLGRRIALTLVTRLSRTMLGLGYAISSAELVLGPVVPSNTARGGGILAPVVDSLARALGSAPDQEPGRAGAWLTLVGAHANLVTAAMFLTGMAANPLLAEAARDVLGVDFDWGTWALSGLVPGLVSLALLPPLLLRLAPPQVTDPTAAREAAARDLQALGPWARGEKVLAAVFVVLIVLWSTKPLHGMGTTLVTWIGVSALVLTGTRRWEEMTAEVRAWDTLVWLGGLLTLASGLKDLGVVAWFAAACEGAVGGLGPLITVITLAVIYFYSMVGFSMLTAHIAAMAAAFLAVAGAAGAPSLLVVALFAAFSNLCACTTTYSTGPVIIYFGLGYVPAAKWFRVGFAVSLLHLVVWLTVGLGWWRVLGWW